MAILRIARMGHPVLRTPARAVEAEEISTLGPLIADMIDTMRDAPGIGLAAPQVHVPLRVVVFHVPEARMDGADGVPLTVLINPHITPLGEETDMGPEACLSVPGLTGQVPRFTRIRYEARDETGSPFVREAEGFHARVVQHECDHLDGLLYPQRMADLTSLAFADELVRAARGTVSETDG